VFIHDPSITSGSWAEGGVSGPGGSTPEGGLLTDCPSGLHWVPSSVFSWRDRDDPAVKEREQTTPSADAVSSLDQGVTTAKRSEASSHQLASRRQIHPE
jgi:hypothetical protein